MKGIEGRLGKVNAKWVRDSVKWLLENECGCCHFRICDTSLKEVDAVIGWHHTDEDDPDTPPKEVVVGDCHMWTHPTREVWKVAWKIGLQSFNNAMQTDMDLDFEMPWFENGDVWDSLVEICGEHGDVPTLKECQSISKEINREARQVVECQLELEKCNQGSGKE